MGGPGKDPKGRSENDSGNGQQDGIKQESPIEESRLESSKWGQGDFDRTNMYKTSLVLFELFELLFILKKPELANVYSSDDAMWR